MIFVDSMELDTLERQVALAGMLLPALAKAKEKAHGIMCVSNNKQMMLAWYLYAEDNNDELVGAAGWTP